MTPPVNLTQNKEVREYIEPGGCGKHGLLINGVLKITNSKRLIQEILAKIMPFLDIDPGEYLDTASASKICRTDLNVIYNCASEEAGPSFPSPLSRGSRAIDFFGEFWIKNPEKSSNSFLPCKEECKNFSNPFWCKYYMELAYECHKLDFPITFLP